MNSIGFSPSTHRSSPATGRDVRFGIMLRPNKGGGLDGRKLVTLTEADKPGKADKPKKAKKPQSRLRKWIKRSILSVVTFLGLTPMVRQPVDDPNQNPVPGDPFKPVFVIHSGFGDVNNWGGHDIENSLKTMGDFGTMDVENDNIVVLKNAYPRLPYEPVSAYPRLVYEGWKQHISDVFHLRMPSPPILYDLAKSLRIFFTASNPDSTVVNDQYRQMQDILKKKGLSHSEVILLGHSSGGQIAMSMSGKNAKMPDPLNISTVVALGTPVMGCPVPDEVKVYTVSSKEDRVVGSLKKIQGFLGMKLVTDHPLRQDGNHFAIDESGDDHMDMARNGYILIYVLNNRESKSVGSYDSGMVSFNGLRLRRENGNVRITTPEGNVYLNGKKIDGEGPETLGEFIKQNPQYGQVKLGGMP